MSLGLVAYSSDEGDSEEEQEETVVQSHRVSLPAPSIQENFTRGEAEEEDDKADGEDFVISDDEDYVPVQNADTSIFLEEQEPDLMSIISSKLPRAKVNKHLIDVKEDLSTIPEKKDYGEKPEEPPAKKKKREGPVRITIPSLKDLQEPDTEEEETRPRIQPSKTGSGLFALLPQPKNKMVRSRPINTAVPESGEEERRGPPAPGSSNLKPRGVRTLGLIPHIVANPVARPPSPPPSSASTAKKSSTTTTPADDSDSDSEDLLGVNSGAYFPAPELPRLDPAAKVNSTPETGYIPGLKRPLPRHMIPQPTRVPQPDTGFLSLNPSDDLGPAVAPYPPPMPAHLTASSSSSSHMVDNDQALARLAGKSAKRRELKEDMAIIDINEDDMKGDPRVWLTKAMTEEMAPAPDRKGPKGLVKSRHQITYLAHQAKERDWELKQEWAQARDNRRASANKYGF